MPKFEDWKAPWEVKGEDFDAEKAKKYVYNLEVDKEKLGEQKAAVVQERDAAATKRDELQAAIDAKAREGESAEQKAQRLEAEIVALKARPASGAVTPEIQQLRLAAAMTVSDDITAKAAMALSQFIQGTTKEEAEASAKTFVETFGIPGAAKEAPKPDDDDDDDEDDDDNPLHSRPRAGGANNPLDRTPPGGGEKPVGELLDLIPRV